MEAQMNLAHMMKQGRSWSGHEPNCCYLNLGAAGEARFANISTISGVDFPDDGRALALTDWDHDGDIDLWFSNRNAPRLRFLRNQLELPDEPSWLAVKLVGNGTTSNIDAIGARVECSGQIRTVRAGDAFLTQSTKWLQFASKTDGANATAKCMIRWPDGSQQTAEIARGQRWLIEQGSAPTQESPRNELALKPGSAEIVTPTVRARIPLVTLMKVPPLDFMTTKTQRSTIVTGQGKPVLVNLWASWCAPCAQELSEFSERHREIAKAGIRVIALSVDELDQESGDKAAALELLKRIQFPFESGFATGRTVDLLERLHHRNLPMERPLPVPTSFLIDGDGKLAVIYKGAVTVSQLLEDASGPAKTRAERLVASSSIGGISLEGAHPESSETQDLSEARQRFQFAGDMMSADLLENAESQYKDLLALKPDFAEAASNLGLVLARQGKLDGAVSLYQRALELKDPFPEVHFNLGSVSEKKGNPAEAERHYLKALDLDARLPKVNNALGLMYAKQSKPAEARARFEREISINPEFADGHNHLGMILLGGQANEEAQTCFEKAITLNPIHADVHNNLGIVLKRLGNLEEAAVQFTKAIELDGAFVPPRTNLGSILLGWGKLDEAEVQFRKVLEVQPGSRTAQSYLARIEAMRPRK